jgi:lysozyme
MKRSAFTVNCLTHPAKLTQNQFDALCSFNLNVGVDNFAKSTLLKLLKVDPDNPSIATEFRKWIYRRKEPAPGQERKHVIEDELKIRREDELKLYFKDD